MKGREDVVFALIKRHKPALEGFDELTDMSHVFNSSQVVADMSVAKAFYLDQLGFKIYLENVKTDGDPGPNLFGIPYNVYPSVTRKICIVSPDGGNEGSVELVQLDGLTGVDFKDRAHPPHLGILMCRFPVDNISSFKKVSESRGIQFINDQVISLGQYGTCRVLSTQSPDGAWIEFYEELR